MLIVQSPNKHKKLNECGKTLSNHLSDLTVVLVSVLTQNKQIHVKQPSIFVSSGVFGLFNSSMLVQVKTTLAITLVVFLWLLCVTHQLPYCP